MLAAFVLLALSWAYVNVDDAVRDGRSEKTGQLRDQLTEIDEAQVENEARLFRKYRVSEESIATAEEARYEARESRDDARERYRTSLDEGDPDAALKRKYQASEADAKAADGNLDKLEARRDTAVAAQEEFVDSQASTVRKLKDELDAYNAATDRIIFLLRLLLTLGALGLSVLLLRLVTERAPRAQPLAQAGVIATSLMALTLLIDYSEISFDFETVGPLGMALLGAIITVGAFFGLQRFLRNRRPNRRLRADECPACGFPGGTNYCENCGEQLMTKCGECGESRRIGVPNCRSCGGR